MQEAAHQAKVFLGHCILCLVSGFHSGIKLKRFQSTSQNILQNESGLNRSVGVRLPEPQSGPSGEQCKVTLLAEAGDEARAIFAIAER